MDKDDSDENTKLLRNRTRRESCARSRSNSVEGARSFEVLFENRMVKTSTQVDDLAATWGGRGSIPDSRGLRRVQSWSGDPAGDANSEVRILRER
jgi:hypothetical protein